MEEEIYTVGVREFDNLKDAISYSKTLPRKKKKTENEIMDEMLQVIDPKRFALERFVNVESGDEMKEKQATVPLRVQKMTEEVAPEVSTQEGIKIFFDNFKEFLLEKNRRYGDSANNRRAVFSKASSDEGILIRLDDKIGRIMNSPELRENDIQDMIGYLALLCVNKGWLNPGKFLD